MMMNYNNTYFDFNFLLNSKYNKDLLYITYMSNDNNNNDNIRNPDPTKIDRLIDGHFELSEDDQLKQILEFSKNEFANLQDIYEKKVIEKQLEEIKERSNQCISIKQKLNKMLVFDKDNKQVYETILSVIEFYIEGYITQYKMNKEEFDKTFMILKTIRLTNGEFIYLQKLIIMEE